jgi:type IV pilus assembly protein PilM
MHTLARLGRAFPPPAYLAMPGAGVDVSQGSVRLIDLEWRGSSATLASYRHADLAPGIIADGEVEKPDELAEVLRSFRLKNHIRFAHASLPERKAFLYQELVPADQLDLAAAVESGLEAHVPLAPAEVEFDFEVVRRVDQGIIVSVTAYARRIVEEYRAAFKRAGIFLKSLEVESQAIARALTTPETRQEVVMVVDFGKVTTRIAIIDHGSAAFTATVDVGGDAMTTAVMKTFKVDSAAAETTKNEKGFLEGAKNRELYEALMTTVSVLKDEVARHIAFWTSEEGAVPRAPVTRIVVVGGNANLKGLPEYLSRVLELPVTVANVWANAFPLDAYVPPLPRPQSLEYATAIGLAVRSRPTSPW